jgi:hypothetical protein
MKTLMRAIIGRAATFSIAALALWSSGCSDCDLKIATGALPDGTVGVLYTFKMDSDCGGDVWFIDGGVLPPGIGLQDDGDLRGTPTTPGLYVFTIGVVDFSSDEQASKGFSIRVVEAP